MAKGSAIRIAIIASAAKAKAEFESLGKSAKDTGKKVAAGLDVKAVGKAAGAAGTVAGGLFAKGMFDNLNIGESNAKLAAQLNLSKADAAKAGDVAGSVYASNWGGSIDEVNAAIRSVSSNLGSVAGTSKKDLEGLTTAALALGSTFEVDVGQTAEAAGKLVKNGLAKNATEAFDILTTGFQGGLDRSGDFLESINEYAPQFAKLGIDGAEGIALLTAGLKAGARDTDVIVDSFKEFSIKALEVGNKEVAAGFKTIGLDAKTMAQEIGAGGDRAQVALQKTLTGLNGIKDPVKQNAAGVALFGTTWEDTLRQILPALAETSLETESVAGATQRMADTAGGSAKAKIDTAKRSFEQWTQSMASSNGALGLVSTSLLTFGGGALAAGAQVGQIATALKGVSLSAGLAVVKTAALAVAQGIASVATGVWTAAQWLLNAALTANPIGLVVLAIVALVAAFVIAYKKSETFRAIVTAAFNAIKIAGEAVWNAIKAVVGVVIGAITAYVRAYRAVVLAVWGAIRGGAVAAWNAISGAVRAVVSRVTGFVSGLKAKVVNLFSGAGNFLVGAGRALVQGFKNGISGAWSSFTGWIQAQINKIPAAVRKVLRIGSPSKVFRTIGQQTGEGLALGLADTQRDIKKAAENLVQIPSASEVKVTATPLIGSTPATRAAAAQAGAATVIELRSSGSKVDDMLLTLLRDAIRTRGGNPQIVLSRAG